MTVAALALVPITGVPLADAFRRWTATIRPTDEQLARDREAGLIEAAALAKSTGDPERAAALEEIRRRLLRGDDGLRGNHARAEWLSRQRDLEERFIGFLQRGALSGRVLIDNVERAILPQWWRGVGFEAARLHRPEIYLDGGELAAWLGTKPAAASFADLVAFLAARIAPAPAPSPTWPDDFAAVRRQFGSQFKREVIRQARDAAYRDRKRKRGRSVV